MKCPSCNSDREGLDKIVGESSQNEEKNSATQETKENSCCHCDRDDHENDDDRNSSERCCGRCQKKGRLGDLFDF